MRPAVAVLAFLWGAASFVISFLMVSNAFVAKTAIKEGIAAQAALLLGGAAIEILAVVLMWQCVRMLRGR